MGCSSEMLSVIQLSLCIWRNRRQVAEVVVFTAVGDGFQGFGISPVGDADTSNLFLLCHIYCLLLFHNGIIEKLKPGDSAAFLHKPDDAFSISVGLRNLIQCILPFSLLLCVWFLPYNIKYAEQDKMTDKLQTNVKRRIFEKDDFWKNM